MRYALLLSALIAAPAAAQIQFDAIASIDLSSTANPASPNFIGTHPSAIRWDSIDLYVAGINAGGATGVGIVKITNVETTPAFGTTFGFIAGTPAGLGYVGLSSQTQLIVASYDHGVPHPRSVQVFGWNDSLVLSLHVRGGTVASIDYPPGGGPDLGVAWTTLGADRRAVQDLGTNTPIYTTADGMVISPSAGTAWRDMTFDYPSGDFYGRKGNDVIKAVRTGVNSCIPSVLVDLTDADSVPGQNVEIFRNLGEKYVIYNDRVSTAPGQSFFNVVKVVDTNGVPRTVNWGAFSPPLGNGLYDFAYVQTGSIAILDSANRRATIFRVGFDASFAPACFGDGTGGACPCANYGSAGNGCANSVNASGGHLTATGVPRYSFDTFKLIGSGMPNGATLYFQGSSPVAAGAGTAFGDGLICAGGTLTRLGVKLNSAGGSQYPDTGDNRISHIPSQGPLTVRTYQAWYRDSAAYCTSDTSNLTNAVTVWWGW